MKFAYVGLCTCLLLSFACNDAAPVHATACEPRTCDESAGACGSIDDGCGGVVDCGACGGEQCVPKTCSELSASCGEAADGCGGVLHCGGCAEGWICKNDESAAACEQTLEPCVPKTCGELGSGCGQSPDGCGHVLDCGTCTAGSVCATSGGTRSCQAVVTVPGKPTAVVATAGTGSARVSWQAPASDGGSTITGYILTVHPDETASTAGLNRTATIQSLVSGRSYTFTVRAVNAVGEGPESEPSNAVVPTAAACTRGLKLSGNYTTDSYSTGVAIADYDKNGTRDVVLGSDFNGRLTLFRNAGGGTLVSSGQVPAANASAVVAADFNRDGATDIASAGSPLLIHTNNGSGTFAPTDSLPSSLINHLEAADVDGDGDMDLLGGGPNGMWGGAVLWMNAQGRFTQGQLFASGRDAVSTAVGDFNKDGRPDVLVAGALSEHSVFVYRGQSDGSFVDGGKLATGGTNVDLARGDWNGDGAMDVAVATTNKVALFIGATGVSAPVAGPSFTEPGSGAEIQDLETLDLDGDGISEIVAVYRWGGAQPRGELVIFRATATSLSVSSRIPVGTAPSNAASGDLNNDGFADLVVSHGDDNKLFVLLNQCQAQ